MFVIYQLEREMTGAWRKVVTCDKWQGVVNFIETYYNGFKAIIGGETYSLPVPKDFEAAFRDVHGNVYVIYDLKPSYIPDIDDDYTDDCREYIRDKYGCDYRYSDYYDSDGYSIDDDWPYEYDRFWRMISSPDFLTEFYLPEPIYVSCADRRNSWYVGALHGI